MVWPFSSSEATTGKPGGQEENQIPAMKEDAMAASKYNRDIRRRRLIGAINENCALESQALLDCQDSWSLWNRVTLCTAFQKNYMDCLNTQRVVFWAIVLI
jgi:hypothetical protein